MKGLVWNVALAGDQVLEPRAFLSLFHREPSAGTTALLSLLSYREPSAGTHGVIVFALVPRSRAPCARQRALPVQYDKSITARCAQ